MTRPEDIRQTARELSGYIQNQMEGVRVRMVIERAILAERERCAGVARSYADQFPRYPEFDEGFNVASEIETLILAAR